MNLFERGSEYNKLAKAFNGIYVLLMDLEQNLKTNPSSKNDCMEDILFIAYLFRKEVLDRMLKYNWPITTSMYVPMISKDKINLNFAFTKVSNLIMLNSELINNSDDVIEVIERGDLFTEIDENIPIQFKQLFS